MFVCVTVFHFSAMHSRVRSSSLSLFVCHSLFVLMASQNASSLRDIVNKSKREHVCVCICVRVSMVKNIDLQDSKTRECDMYNVRAVALCLLK